MNNNVIYKGLRGLGFALYAPPEPYTSVSQAYEDLINIPMYNYIIIDNVASYDEHGKIYQKIYNSSGSVELRYVTTLAGPAPSSVYSNDVILLDSGNILEGFPEAENVGRHSLKDFLNILLNKLSEL